MTAAGAANLVIPRCGSTNDLARALGEQGWPHGTWISAETQESGRGRLGRRWECIEGNLFLSLVVRRPERPLWSWVPLTIAVGAASALRALDRALEPGIKWPNDLYLDGVKLGGILCEAGAFVTAGIGINCVSAPPGAISLSEKLGRRADADLIREPVLRAALAWLETLEREGPEPVRQAYEGLAELPPGARVSWGEQGERGGWVDGLGPAGELRVRVAGESAPRSLFAEDVRAVRKASAGSPA